MADSDKIRIVLADEDALRRDGLAAVLVGAGPFEIVAKSPDGTAALEAIRDHRPDVAVVDLNLPGLHGIELVRRVRSEGLGAKLIILAGTTDDEIVREVVRAGADGYLLKNGPARHLVDAINYVRDGGQYFSPQLRRDGRDRHLLEEPPRPIADPPAARRRPEAEPEIEEEGYDHEERDASQRSLRPAGGRAAAQYGGRQGRRAPVRERLRDEAHDENLKDRDYEILDMMAEGIRPILDRLEDIEGRIGDMETGDQPVPSDIRGWLNSQIADSMGDARSAAPGPANRSMQDLESRLPQMIEQAVTSRFQQMAGKLQKEIEDTHVRTLETFVKNIQVKLVQRVAALETDMSKQADAMKQLREYSERTEDNLTRLISGVDKLAQDLPRRLQAPIAAASPGAGMGTDPVAETVEAIPVMPRPLKRKSSSSRHFSPKTFWAVVGVLVVLGGGGALLVHRSAPGGSPAVAAGGTPAAGGAASAESKGPAAPARDADTKTKMDIAGQYSDRKEYSAAEDIYRQVLKAEPNNVDAMKALASVLYREDKIEESAAILDKIPR